LAPIGIENIVVDEIHTGWFSKENGIHKVSLKNGTWENKRSPETRNP